MTEKKELTIGQKIYRANREREMARVKKWKQENRERYNEWQRNRRRKLKEQKEREQA